MCKAFDKITADKVDKNKFLIFFSLFLLPDKLQQTTSLVRSYSSEYPVDIQMIKDRVLLVLRLYDKINPEKVTHLIIQQGRVILLISSLGIGTVINIVT